MTVNAYPALVACIVLGCSPLALARVSATVSTPSQTPVVSTNITEADVLAAQTAWGDALVQISTEYDESGIAKAKATASAVIDAAYGYNMGAVLFKPTLTVAPQTFRLTKEGALSYFVGGNPAFPNDKGFALKSWRAYKVVNSAIQLHGNTAMSIGTVAFTDKNGKVTTVDKTWGYVRDDQGALRIVLHHSSLPYQP